MNDIDEHIACINLVYDMINSPIGIDVCFSGIDVRFAEATRAEAIGAILISGKAIQSGSVIPDAVFQYIKHLMRSYCDYIKTDLYVRGIDIVGDSYYFTLPEIVLFPKYNGDRFGEYDKIEDRILVLKRALYENADISFRWDSSDEPADSAGISQELDSFLNTFKRRGGDRQ